MTDAAASGGSSTRAHPVGLVATGVAFVPFVLVGLAAVLPRFLTAGHFETVDEPKWMARSAAFAGAVVHGRLSDMTITTSGTSTMPGITTMWLGSLARVIFAVGKQVGLVPQDQIFEQSTQGLAIAQSTVAVTTAALIGLVAWLVARWASPRVGIAFGLLLATEPFWVAHGAVLHTDELMTLFGMAGLLCLAIVLEVPRRGSYVDDGRASSSPRRWFVASGVLLACAVLTKITALVWGVSALVVVVWAMVRRIRGRPPTTTVWEACRSLGIGIALAVGGAVATVVVLYPASWTDPVGQWDRLTAAAALGGEARETFFRGEVVAEAPTWFYAFALPWRLTPWALAVVVVGVPAALLRRASRSRTLLAVAFLVPPAVLLSAAAAKYDRYGLLLVAPILLAGCLALQPTPRTRSRGVRSGSRLEWPTVAGLGLAALVYSISVVPWGLVYFDPALGGGTKAQSELAIGWFEERSAAYRVITRDVHRRGASCASVTTTGTSPEMVSWSECGRWAPHDGNADYRVIGITKKQRMNSLVYLAATHDRTLVDVVKVRGIRYVEVWRRDRPARGS